MFANRGEIIVSLVGEPTRQGVTVVARDAGPGIPDLERAVQDGYSGYGGMGLGLPGSRRLMDEFHRGSDTSANVAPLVRAGARIDDRDDADRTALMWAVMGLGTSFDVRPSVIAALVENGADVGATDVNGETAMFHLVRYVDDALALDRGADCIQVLLDAGANPNAENNENKTPLAVVDPRNHLVLDLLRDLGFTA
jgi:hypothetical protein